MTSPAADTEEAPDLTRSRASVMVGRWSRWPPQPTETPRAHAPHRSHTPLPELRRACRPDHAPAGRTAVVASPIRHARSGVRAFVLTDPVCRVPGTHGLDESIVRLVPQAAAGDQAAFTRLVAAFHADMVRVAYVISGGDGELAQDAAQSAWAIAWSRLHTLREPERIRAWLVSIAANEARQGLRRQRRVVAVGLEDADVPFHATPSARDLDLAAVLARLRPDERALIGLRYVAGLDSREIGAALGISASGVRSRLDRLLDRLRAELGDE